MRPIDEIKNLFDNNKGILQTGDLYKAHIFYHDIQSLIENNVIEKVRYGKYQLVNRMDFSEVATITRLFPDGIFCMDTALFYYRYSDRTPYFWHIAVSKHSGKSRFKINYPFVKPYYVEPSILDLGVNEGNIDNNMVRIYDKERTICDCLRYVGKMDKEIFSKAIRSYIVDETKNIPRLIEYAKKLRVLKKVKTIIGVWI